MGKVVASLFASLDGYASDAPDEEMKWVTDDFGEEMMRNGLEQVKTMDTLLFGRHLAERAPCEARSRRGSRRAEARERG